MGVRPAVSPGLLRNVKDVVEVKAPFLQFAKHDLGGEELGGRGRRHRLVGVLFVEDRAAVVILDQCEIGAGRKRLIARVRGRRQNDERDANGPEPDEAHRKSFDKRRRGLRRNPLL